MSKPYRTKLYERLVASWLKHDPFVSLVVKNDDRTRRDIMLNIVGPQAAMIHFGKFPPRTVEEGPIVPNIVRQEVQASLDDDGKRTQLVMKLIRWATDASVNNRYIKSHLTRIQIVRSLLGPIFFRATAKQEDLLLRGLKFMIAKKTTVIDKPGEQSSDVHDVVLECASDTLIYHQKVIINKALTEVEEKMRVQLLRQIQEIRGKKNLSQYYSQEVTKNVRKIIKEKFPLRRETARHFEEILDFYRTQNRWPYLQEEAVKVFLKIQQLRNPLTLTAQKTSS